jgi:hypothetical protein
MKLINMKKKIVMKTFKVMAHENDLVVFYSFFILLGDFEWHHPKILSSKYIEA